MAIWNRAAAAVITDIKYVIKKVNDIMYRVWHGRDIG